MAQVLAGAVGGGETAAAASGVSDPSAASTRPPAGFAARKAYNKTHLMNSVKASVLGLLQGNDARKRIVLEVIEERVEALTSIWVQATRLVNLLMMQCLQEGTDPPARVLQYLPTPSTFGSDTPCAPPDASCVHENLHTVMYT